MKKILSIILFIIGIGGAIYYTPLTIMQFDSTLGSIIVRLVGKYTPIGQELYEATAFNIAIGWGSYSPIWMLLIMLVLIGLAVHLWGN